jgi:predicted acyl esterase
VLVLPCQFSPGHRVRVAISSSNYERFSVNPNNGDPLNVNGTMLIAENTFYHSAQYASYLEV